VSSNEAEQQDHQGPEPGTIGRPPGREPIMPVLTDAELHMVAEVVTEFARCRGSAFNRVAKGHDFARAALIDPAFKARLAEVHRRLEARRATDIPRKMVAPLAPLFRDLERDAERINARDH